MKVAVYPRCETLWHISYMIWYGSYESPCILPTNISGEEIARFTVRTITVNCECSLKIAGVFGVGVNSFRRLTLHFEIMCCSMNCMFIWALKSSTIWKMLFCLSCDNIWLVLEISLQTTKTIRHCTDSHKTMIHCTTFFWISVLLGKTRSGQWVGCCRCSIVRLNLIKHDWETPHSGSSVTLVSDSFLHLVSSASSFVNVLEHWF